MTELEALKVVRNRAKHATSGPDPELKEALSMVSELIERVEKAEGNEFTAFLLAEDMLLDVGWVPLEYVEARLVRKCLEEHGAGELAGWLSTREISKAIDEITLGPRMDKLLPGACELVVLEAARFLCKRHGQAWSEPYEDEE